MKKKQKRFLYPIASVFILISLVITSFSYYRRQKHHCDVGVMGAIKFNDGMGRQTIGLIDCLKKSCSIKYVKYKGIDSKDLPRDVGKIAKLRYSASPNILIFESPLMYPKEPEFPSLPNAQIKFAYSMLESTKIPQNWVKILNTKFDAVLVPDEFLVEAYINSGVKVPIFVLPLGMYLDPFLEKSHLRTKPINRPFVFGNLGSFVDRKNQMVVLQAFAKAFGNDPKIQLVFNGRAGEEKYFSNLQEEKRRLGLTNVTITNIPLDWKNYIEEFSSLDCYVSVSKGEGFSLQPREAIALGIPSIVTDNTGQSTICRSGHVYSLASTKRVPAFYQIFQGWYEDLGDHFECDVDDLAKAMSEIYSQYDHHAQIAYSGKVWLQQYQYENLKDLYECIINPKRIELTDRNEITEGVLYTNSQSLCEKYKKLNSENNLLKKVLNSLIVSICQ